MGRNTPILTEIVTLLEKSTMADSLAKLETHFRDRLLVDAGSVTTIVAYAEQLRLNITTEECAIVLDHMAERNMAAITLDEAEEAINALYQDRFIEP